MGDLAQIEQEIERIRNSLNDLVGCKKYDISDPEVTSLSKHLDSLIVDYQQMKADSVQQRSK